MDESIGGQALVLPALAGMSQEEIKPEEVGARAPRASGDEPASVSKAGLLVVVLPALAGMSPPVPAGLHRIVRAPRASGDEPLAQHPGIQRLQCSPR